MLNLLSRTLLLSLGFLIPLLCWADTEPRLGVQILSGDGSYKLFNNEKLILHAQVAAKVDGVWLHASDYPKHLIEKMAENETRVRHTGLPGKPDLIYALRTSSSKNAGEIVVHVNNTLRKPLTIQAIRLLETSQLSFGNRLRVLSDTYSEDRPTLAIYEYGQAPQGLHRAVGSQLLYNRDTHQSLFFAALTSKRFLTIMHLDSATGRFEVDAAGTTEINKDFSLKKSPPEDQIELSLNLAPGHQLESEALTFNLSSNYHSQLEDYGRAIRTLHRARVSAPNPMGWWSWTAYYRELNQDQALKDAIWQSENLKNWGYAFFHLDEGYQAARGDYTSPNLRNFPDGIAVFVEKIRNLGLTLGLWTAPFEVSEHSELYRDHKDWLVQNMQGRPITLIREDETDYEKLYVLDTTHPEAQEFLRATYTTLAKEFGARYFKLDFMEDSAVEGRYFRANTTALEAQRLGLEIIREVVGEDVLLDKDGSPMLNPVGVVDTGRISVDTGHSFEKTKFSAVGVAARYYMHHNFFVADPDAFTISRFRKDQLDELTMEEAKTSIALAVVSGGIFEIGDNLQLLKMQPERLKWLKNPELLNLVREGKASTPLDLMTYQQEDEQPSIFFLRQSPEQAMLTVFNWTEENREHFFDIKNLGFNAGVNVREVFENDEVGSIQNGTLRIVQPPHSVRMLKISLGEAK